MLGLGLDIVSGDETQTPVPPKVRGFYVPENSAMYVAENGTDIYVNVFGQAYMTEASGRYVTENAASSYVTENRS